MTHARLCRVPWALLFFPCCVVDAISGTFSKTWLKCGHSKRTFAPEHAFTALLLARVPAQRLHYCRQTLRQKESDPTFLRQSRGRELYTPMMILTPASDFVASSAVDTSALVDPPAIVRPLKVSTSKALRPKASFVTKAVEKIGPAVVRVNTESDMDPQFFPDPLQERESSSAPKRGQGSGFIVRDDGLVVTNAHVVSKAGVVTVTIADGTTFSGKVLGKDDYMDLAVVKIDLSTDTLRVARLSSSNDVQVGDYAIAVGNPFGLSNSVTLGIVSGIGRLPGEVGLGNEKVNFIQTDAVLNPGNSGGPLVNEFGEVIGVNSAVIRGANGVGFAIPIDEAIPAIEELAQGRRIPHPFVGVSMAAITPELAQKNNEDPNADFLIPEIEGAFITRVQPGGPAIKGGLRKFDVIVNINGQEITQPKQASAIIDSAKVGVPIEVKVMRQGELQSFMVTPGDLSNMN